ncbi:hypothetical protein [uncultured Cedecea sp.]|uniref:hypothetical protein n=1 Tax=uncultured Cedecea sp. TaxID=988762 RepID=UPI00261804B3|nr:hypothetical protein [uncultured Cedecea sp.]
MNKTQTLRAAISTLENIYETEHGADWLYEIAGQTGGSLIDMLERIVTALDTNNLQDEDGSGDDVASPAVESGSPARRMTVEAFRQRLAD